MRRRTIRHFIAAIAVAAAPVCAQEALTLSGAIGTALQQHPSMEVAAARIRAAEARIEQAKGSYLPKVNYQESWARSNNPVFVFSSLLTQHQFSAANFDLGPLNRPEALNNFQSLVSVDQILYDAGQIRAGVKSARIGRQMTDEAQRSIRLNVIAGVVRSYYGVVLARESLDVAREAVRSAEADLDRAQSVRQAGMSTDADVLSIRVHLASVKEQEVRSQADLQVAGAALNEAIGVPLDTPHQLSTQLTVLGSTESATDQTPAARPEARQALLAAQAAEQQIAAAKSSLLPQVGLRGAFEADRQRFIDRGGANWMLAVSLKWNLFNGNSDRARIAEAQQELVAAHARQRQVDQAVRLQVRKAEADLKASGERVAVSSAAVRAAEESLRISKNRFGAGLSTVTDLLRTETALLDVRLRRLAAIYDQRVAAVALEQAEGLLSENSPAVR